MKKLFARELPLWILILIPIVYLANKWEAVSEIVPLRFNHLGEPTKWGSKIRLLYLSTLLPIGTYIVLCLAKYFDPKQSIGSMGQKFYTVRFLFTLFQTVVLLMFFFSLVHQVDYFQTNIYLIAGLLFLFLGNFYRNLKPNLLIGFRTPWALINQAVWKSTHQQCSTLWFAGGLLLIIINLSPETPYTQSINLTITIFLVLFPTVYSFRQYLNLQKADE